MPPDPTPPAAACPSVPLAGPAQGPAVTPAAPPAPGTITVTCPSGFTKSSLAGLDPKKPLYARVTYRPT